MAGVKTSPRRDTDIGRLRAEGGSNRMRDAFMCLGKAKGHLAVGDVVLCTSLRSCVFQRGEVKSMLSNRV
jgi:hypothetical protein